VVPRSLLPSFSFVITMMMMWTASMCTVHTCTRGRWYNAVMSLGNDANIIEAECVYATCW
jgi:hypothetical protein